MALGPHASLRHGRQSPAVSPPKALRLPPPNWSMRAPVEQTLRQLGVEPTQRQD